MTREETQKLLLTISSLYPNFEVKDKTLVVDSWSWALKDYPVSAVMGALEIYIKTSNTGFAPSVSQLITAMHSPKKHEQLSEGEAWMMVKKAIGDSFYHGKEHFDNLPPLVQRAVGSPSMLAQWGSCDSDEVNTVIMSNFQRSYRALLTKQEYSDKVPPQLADVVKGVTDKMSERMISENEEL